MQFLHEEFFGKVYGFIKNINILPIRILVKLIFWGILFGILGVLTWLFLTGRQNQVFWIVGLFLVAEGAHFLRKSRERKLAEGLEESNNIQDQLAKADIIKEDKKSAIKKNILNEQGLLKKKKIIKKEKVINNEGLLKNSVKVKIIKKR